MLLIFDYELSKFKMNLIIDLQFEIVKTVFRNQLLEVR